MIGAGRFRTHTCLDAAGAEGAEVRVAGWVHRRRDHGGVLFIDLRDRSGVLQLVIHPDTGAVLELAQRLSPEDVISASGTLVARSAETVNPRIPTGGVELRVTGLEVLSEAAPLPFSVEDEHAHIGEELRLTYRYLDLRRGPRLRALELRGRVVQAIRTVLEAEGFLEVETPILTRSTPEGARDFLVPSRLQQGTFYALPQSPQLFKQLLMVGGLERYYQIVRCFRDEDLRADRQPEFTQVDIEASFVEPADIQRLVEAIMVAAWAHGRDRARDPLPAHGLPRGGAALRHRPAGRAVRLRDPRLDARGGRVGARGVCERRRRRRRGAGDRRSGRGRRAVAQGPRRPGRRGQGARGQGAGLGGAGRRGCAAGLGQGRVPGGAHRGGRGGARATWSRWSPTPRPPPNTCSGRCGCAGPSASGSSPRGSGRRCGSSISRWWSGTPTRAAGMRCTTRSRRRDRRMKIAYNRIPARSWPRPTTW